MPPSLSPYRSSTPRRRGGASVSRPATSTTPPKSENGAACTLSRFIVMKAIGEEGCHRLLEVHAVFLLYFDKVLNACA